MKNLVFLQFISSIMKTMRKYFFLYFRIGADIVGHDTQAILQKVLGVLKHYAQSIT